jgi:ketosteroid isomerase-like protein
LRQQQCIYGKLLRARLGYRTITIHISFGCTTFMPRTKLPASSLGGSPDETEATFYEALHKGDIDLLMSCWAEDDDIVCVHPGGSRLMGATAIRAAFDGMFSQGSIRVTISQVHRVQSVSSAVHSVAERVEIMLPDGLHAAFLIATNVYHRTLEGWRLVAHHASAGGTPEGIPGQEVPPILH